MSIEKDILDNTKIYESESSDSKKGLPQPPLEETFDEPLIDLPDPLLVDVKDMGLKDAILLRKSNRKFLDKALSIESLSYSLYMTQGIKKLGNKHTLRTVPSAGARHAFETYMIIRNVAGLVPGIYRYIASKHKLIFIDDTDIKEKLLEATLNQKMLIEASVTFFWVANTHRMTYRYQNRGYRYLFLDAGHVMQNLYLVATQLGLGTCAVAAYDDDAVNEIFHFDGYQKFVIYIAPLGFV